MYVDDEDHGPGGIRPEDLRDCFKGGWTGGVAFWVRDVGLDPQYRAVPGQIQAQGRATDHLEADKAVGGEEMGLSSAGGSDRGSGFWKDRGIHHKEAEYGCAIYCNVADSVSLWAIYLEAGRLDLLEVVGSGRTWLRGGKEESGCGVKQRGRQVRKGSGTGGDEG